MTVKTEMDKHVDSFIEGLMLGAHVQDGKVDMMKVVRTLAGTLHCTRKEVARLDERIEQMDAIAVENDIRVRCNSCGDKYTIDWNLSEHSIEGSYCGKDPRCCP